MLLFAAAIATSGAPAHGHHSIASVYDNARQATLEGIVSQFQLINPHPFLLIDVTDGAGNAARWRLEMDNRSELVEVGMSKETLKPGDRIVVSGNPAGAQAQNLYIQTS